MKFEAVESTNLVALGYDRETRRLGAQFKNGGEYVYEGVPEDIYHQVKSAPSVGSAFHQLIKNGGFPYTKTN